MYTSKLRNLLYFYKAFIFINKINNNTPGLVGR